MYKTDQYMLHRPLLFVLLSLIQDGIPLNPQLLHPHPTLSTKLLELFLFLASQIFGATLATPVPISLNDRSTNNTTVSPAFNLSASNTPNAETRGRRTPFRSSSAGLTIGCLCSIECVL